MKFLRTTEIEQFIDLILKKVLCNTHWMSKWNNIQIWQVPHLNSPLKFCRIELSNPWAAAYYRAVACIELHTEQLVWAVGRRACVQLELYEWWVGLYVSVLRLITCVGQFPSSPSPSCQALNVGNHCTTIFRDDILWKFHTKYWKFLKLRIE